LIWNDPVLSENSALLSFLWGFIIKKGLISLFRNDIKFNLSSYENSILNCIIYQSGHNANMTISTRCHHDKYM